MRQIVTTGTGDIDVLKVQQKPDLTPGEGEVVIRVRAAGLNFADILSASTVRLKADRWRR
jgi:NADPH:quinone reductase-like Zn-dependent oxidoreductase